MNETKGEIRARISEIDFIMSAIAEQSETGQTRAIAEALSKRRAWMENDLEHAEEDLFKSVLRSHKALCAVKEMEEDAAYGQNAAIYYSLAVSGECGEMSNKIVKALRNGNDPEAARNAVISELPDVIIYSAVLAHVLNIDLTALVNEKVKVVIQRAESGYYGGPLPTGSPGSRRKPA